MGRGEGEGMGRADWPSVFAYRVECSCHSCSSATDDDDWQTEQERMRTVEEGERHVDEVESGTCAPSQ